jgi:cytochrome c oxidase cbb3-type subunit 3
MKLGLKIGSTILLAAALLTALTVTSARPAPDSAEDLFKSKCSMCHGPEGKGFSAIKTPDFTDPKWQASKKDAELKSAIKDGKKDTMMKGFGDKLSEEEIGSLVKFIRSLNTAKKK